MPPLDEDRRRQFERHRRAGGGDALDTFLPEPSSPTFEATLEELVLIDLEMAWKAWHAGGAVGAPPALDDHLERWAHLRQPSVRARLQHESAWLGAHYRPDALRAGVHLGRYALQERIGQGSCAEVWRAWDDDLGRDVALKVPHASVALGSQTMARARREALAAAGLRHPGIVTVHGVEEHAGRPFFVLEFVRGRTLAGAQTEVQADRAGAVRLLARVADAIGYAHAMGVIHRDLKPANILLDAQGQPRVTDFGLARLAAGRGDLTQHGEVLGTPAYMAPEQARGATAEVGPAADIYSMGVLLYELLSGRRPFEGVTAEATLYSVVHEEAPPLRRIVPDLPIDLDTITGKAMAREAGRRYASAMELAADLRRYLAHRPIEARRVGVVERGVLWVRRNPVLAATVLTSVLAIFSVAGVGFRNVLEERGRFRQERDRAEGNLLRSLLGEASALREAQGVDWRVRAMALLRSAAPLAKDAAERLRVRNLVAACASTHGPAFHRVAIWDTGDGAARSVASDADGARIAVVTRRGGLRVLGTRNGDTVLFVPPGDVKATALDWVGQGDGLVVGFADGHLEMRGGAALSLRATTPPTGSEVHAVAGHPEALMAAVGHAGGSIQLVGWSDDADDLVLLQRLAGHEGGTLALAFSADGEQLLSGGVDHATCLWAWREGHAVTTVLDLDPVRFVAFHGAQGALSATYEQYGFRLVDLATGRQLEPLDPSGMHARPVTGLEVDRERHVLTTAADGTLSIWTARRLGRRVQFERVHHGLTGMGPITACAVLGEDGDLVAAHEDGRLSRWRRRPAAVTHRWATGQEAAFLPGTHVLATTNGLWSYTPGAPPQEWPWTHDRVLEFLIPTGRGTIACLHASGATQHLTDEGPVPWTRVSDVSAAAALADGADLVLGTRSGEIVIVPTAPGAAVRHLDAHRGAILALAAPPGEGAACYVLGQSGLAVLRVDGERWERLDDRPRERGVLAAGGDLLAVGEPDGAVTLWDARRGVHVRSLSGDAQAPMRCLSLSTAGELLLGIDDEGTAHLWQTDSGAIVWSVEGPRVASPQCRIDTGLGAAVLLRGGPEVLHLRSGRPAATVPLLASAVAIDRGGDRLVVAGRRGGAWSIGLPAVRDALEMVAAPAEPARRTAPRTLALEQELLPGGHPDSIWGLAVSPDARWIATSGHHGAVVLRDARTGHQLRTLDSFGALAWTVSFSPDSRVLAVGAGHDVRLYAVATGEEVGRLQGHDGLVTSIAFHPEAPLIVTSSQDRSVRMWDATAGTAAGTLDVDAAVVSELEFDPGAVWLAAACADGSVLFWDARPASLAPGAAPVRRWSGHGTAAWTLAFDSRGALLASGSEDGQILLRDVRTGETRIELRGEPRLRSLSFTSDGRYLAGACWSAPSTTWDLASLGAELTSLGAAWGNDGLLPHDLTPR